MKCVLLKTREILSEKELRMAEEQARACGMTLDQWLVQTLKSAIAKVPLDVRNDQDAPR